jgi:hypothetical protein
MIRSRLTHVVAAAAALSLAALTAAVSAGPADAAFVPRPRTYTAVMTPTAAQPGTPTAYSVVVTNTSSVISALDHFVLVVPSGFTVTPGTVTAPRGGWTESLAAGLLSAATSTPLRTGLRQGESITVRFTATAAASVPCGPRTATWVQKADGVIIDPFIAQSDNPTVAVSAVADRFRITDVTDGGTPALHRQVRVAAPFTVTGQFLCGAVPAPTAGTTTLSLAKSAPGTPDAGGALGGNVSTSVPAGSTTAAVAGATYSKVENQVGIAANWSGGTGDSFRLDVFGDVQAVIATPGVAIDPARLTVPGAQADLRNGANGLVTIAVSACIDPTVAAPCRAGTEIQLNGNFKDAAGKLLYSFTAPARVSYLCAAATCPHLDQEPSANYDYNYDCPGTSCVGEGSLFGEREVEEDFTDNPVFVSLKRGVVDGPFARAPRCVPLPTSDYDPNRYALLHLTGQIVNPAAQTLGFCLDVNAITRAGNRFTGDLRLPVLFVEDFKMRP